MDGFSTEPPCDVRSFQAQLDRACIDHSIQLRIVWAPSLIARRLGNRTFRKYPDPTRPMEPFLEGFYFVRNGRVVGYQSIEAGSLVKGDVLPDDLVVPHIEHEQPGIPLWMIEQRVPDEVAKRTHARMRYGMVNGRRIDVFGEFPKEGWWNWFEDISEHRDNCCDFAQQNDQICRGLYREPDERDLEMVRQALWYRSQMPHLQNMDEPASARQIEQYVKAKTDAVKEWESRHRAEEAKRIGEEVALELRQKIAPSVYVDLREMKQNANTVSDPSTR